jgi:putative chitinase
MINRAIFFDNVRKLPFPGSISQTQVAGCNALLDEAERRGFDFRWTAYCLATAYHETAHTMLPIAEYGRGKGKAYGEPINGKVYYGRGYVQLTWIKNYEKMGACSRPIWWAIPNSRWTRRSPHKSCSRG